MASSDLVSNPPEKLSLFEFEQLKNNLFQIVERENPRLAIVSLKYEMGKNKAVLNSCHELLHEVGFRAYDKYGDFATALTYKDDVCVSAYTHGVIEGYFSKVKNIPDVIESMCKDYPIGKFITWECYHGVGHGLMYFNNNDVPKSLEGCKFYRNDFDRSACSNGVYMENFNADSELHPSRFLNSNDPFYPCDELEQDKKDCYVNASIYFLALKNYDYMQAFDWCESSKEYKDMCFFGLASQMARRNMEDPKFVEQSCMEYKENVIDSCIGGLVSWYVSYNASVVDGENICKELESRNRSKCQEVLGAFRTQF